MRDYDELIERLRYCADRPICFSTQCDYRQTAHIGACFDSLKHDAADAIEELLDELTTIRKQLPRWTSVEERLPERTNPFHARDVFLVRLRSGCIKTLFYEYDNSDRCRTGMSPLFKEGWAETATPVTHWMPLPAPPKGVE